MEVKIENIKIHNSKNKKKLSDKAVNKEKPFDNVIATLAVSLWVIFSIIEKKEISTNK